MAQLLRYHQYPTTGIGVNTKTIHVDDVKQQASTRGGDGSGGAYDWTLMPLNPSTSTDSEKKMIGSLCYDAGVSVEMYYTNDGSGTDTLKSATAFTSIFKYANAIPGYNSGNELVGNGFNEMANPNLDAGLPVLLGITGSGGGHAIVCDGYGYNNSVLYHHLNMGWSGSDNAWYDLPNIGTWAKFDKVYKCVYNVFKTGTGEIISGRVTNGATAQQGVQVTANDGAGGTFTDTTDQYGIYAFPNVKSATTYTISCSEKTKQVTTGTSTANSKNCGNKWEVNFNISSGSYSISGTITGDTKSGVTITVTGSGTGSASSGQDGTYTVSDLSAGTYIVTPSKTNYTFSPATRTVEITNQNVTSCDFTATQGGTDKKVTIGSEFTIIYANGLDKKPTVYAAYIENGKTKKKSVKVTDTSKDFPSDTVNCLWTSKATEGNYDLCIKGVSNGQKIDKKVETAVVTPPTITGVSSIQLVPGEELTVTGTYFGTKPKTWFEYERTVCGNTKNCKSLCKIVRDSVTFDSETGASSYVLIVPKIKDDATNIRLWVDSGTGSGAYP